MDAKFSYKFHNKNMFSPIWAISNKIFFLFRPLQPFCIEKLKKLTKTCEVKEICTKTLLDAGKKLSESIFFSVTVPIEK